MRNLLTDVPGLRVGNAQDEGLASGVTAVVFEAPAVASCAIHGGAPGVRDTALLEPEMTVQAVDAFVLSGGSAFGLDAMGGAMAYLRDQGRGLPVGAVRVPIVPGAILFDLTNGGAKDWGPKHPYWELGRNAAAAAGLAFALGTAGAGYGATLAGLKGGLGSASTRTSGGYVVAALAAVNAGGAATVGDSPHFWAWALERDAEFGGRGAPTLPRGEALALRLKGQGPQNTSLAVVATDAPLLKPQAKRLAVQAQDGFALALRPAHGAMDGDVVFAASTGLAGKTPNLRDLAEIGMAAADCVARAVARGVYEAEALPFSNAMPSWKDLFG
ncbi:MAG TPA: P1 family peptidase [Beijerinckiaceae bacterium]|nr:P1 family peptidase [Beijerinckiaceae bacterium]